MIILCMAFSLTGCGRRDNAPGDNPSDDTKALESMTEQETFEEDLTDLETLQTERLPQSETFETETQMQSTEAEEDPVVIILDPGHDDKECCTNSHPELNMYEQELNLAIGLACRDRLQEYEGITVYMTRTDGSCPDEEHGGEECIKARTDMTAKVDADMFISLHCNGSTGVYGAEANGCEVYVSGYPAFYEDSARLGELIIKGLTSLDLADGGVRVRVKEEKGTYDDGTVKDWYYLISNNVDAGYPAIIVEHAYMDNAHDNAILLDEKNLAAMGRADADAIAAFYGLHLMKNAGNDVE